MGYFMLRRTIVNWVCVLVLSLLGHALGAEQDGGTLILNESAYCRAYYQLDVQKIAPKALKAEGEGILGATLLNRLEKQVKKTAGVEELRLAEGRLARTRHVGGGIQQLRAQK